MIHNIINNLAAVYIVFDFWKACVRKFTNYLEFSHILCLNSLQLLTIYTANLLKDSQCIATRFGEIMQFKR